jgi:hypothetical protein
MNPLDLPFNVQLMKLDKSRLAAMKPVTSLDYFETVNGDLHEDGLFSISIFGRIGDELRDKRFSFIDVRVQIFHPIIYTRLVKLKNLYRGILAGTEYAEWDDELKDFVASTEIKGKTGYAFFISYWDKIEFSRNRSGIRDARISLIEKYRSMALTDKVLVLPAGLRDIEVDENGQTKEHEINAIYRRLLGISKTIAPSDHNNTSTTLNLPRHLIQMAFNDVYDTIERMLVGKKGLVQNRWSSRRIFHGTRNVISAMDTSTPYLGGKNSPRFTDTVLGMYQTAKAYLPVTIHSLNTGYLEQIFNVGVGQARLIDKQTFKGEIVTLPTDVYDRWTTSEGLEKVITSLAVVEQRHIPIELADRYLALVYVGPDAANPESPLKVFKVFHDIDELPEGFDRAHVRPINLIELIYLSGYKHWNSRTGFVTRYPVTGVDSCYATTLYVKTTMVGEMRRELGPDWQPLDETHDALEFPVYQPLTYLDSQVIPSARLKGLGADFDGDTACFNGLMSEEANDEVLKFLTTRAAYIDPHNELRASANVPTVALVLLNMTG